MKTMVEKSLRKQALENGAYYFYKADDMEDNLKSATRRAAYGILVGQLKARGLELPSPQALYLKARTTFPPGKLHPAPEEVAQ